MIVSRPAVRQTRAGWLPLLVASLSVAFVVWVTSVQAYLPAVDQDKSQAGTANEHQDQILGVRVGMSVPEALKAVYEHTTTVPAPQKPDALKQEGKDQKDIQVVYKHLDEGELQILFAGGKSGYVRAVTLSYAKQPAMSDLHLPPTGSIKVMTVRSDSLSDVLNDGQIYDTRYSVGFVDDRKQERYWWRDESAVAGYTVRVGFISKKVVGARQDPIEQRIIARKIVMVKPGDEDKFEKTVGRQ